jgi:hypothetical protein
LLVLLAQVLLPWQQGRRRQPVQPLALQRRQQVQEQLQRARGPTPVLPPLPGLLPWQQ